MRQKRRTRARGRSVPIAESLKGLVEAVVDRVLARVQRELPDRDQIRTLEKDLHRLTKRVEARGLRGGGRRVGRPRLDRKCKVAGCGLPHVAQGFCSKHYQAWRRRKIRAGNANVRRFAGRG